MRYRDEMPKAGGTSAPEPRSWSWLLAFVIDAVVATFLVHKLSAGDSCGWNYGGVGGACRAIILLSILSGLVSGVFAVVSANAFRDERRSRAWSFAIAAVVVVVLGTLAAKQFQDYRTVSHYAEVLDGHTFETFHDADRPDAGLHEMNDPMCTFAKETLPKCVGQVMGADAEATVRHAQPNCSADSHSMMTYEKCMVITDCKQVVDCVSNAP